MRPLTELEERRLFHQLDYSLDEETVVDKGDYIKIKQEIQDHIISLRQHIKELEEAQKVRKPKELNDVLYELSYQEYLALKCAIDLALEESDEQIYFVRVLRHPDIPEDRRIEINRERPN